MTIFQDILAKISAYPTIIIHRHENPDPDAIGSQSGLANVIKNSFPDKKVYKVGGPIGDLDWIDTMDTIGDDIYQDALVIVCDTANTPRISDKRYDQGAYLIKIDHHPMMTTMGIWFTSMMMPPVLLKLLPSWWMPVREC